MNNPLISIIIPVYNVERYVPKCLDSVIQQTYPNLDIVLVDDGSPDKSGIICDEYAQKDSRIQVIHKKNEGVDKARFSGLNIANGDYVIFVDSDDWLCDKDIFRKMIAKAEETNADYVEMGMQHVMDKYGLIKHTSTQTITGLITQPELFDKYYISFFGYNILSVNIWGKLYRKSILDKANLTPSGLKMGEDLAFNLNLFPHLINSIYILEDIGYSYRFGGMTTRYNPSLYPDLKKLYLLKESLIEKYQYFKAEDLIKIEIKNVLKSNICQQIIFKVGTKDQIISNISKELSDSLWDRALQIENHPNFFNEPFVQAIQNKDAEKAYTLCLEKVNKDKWSRLAKRILSFIFTHI